MQCWGDSFRPAVWPFVHWEALMYLLWNKKFNQLVFVHASLRLAAQFQFHFPSSGV